MLNTGISFVRAGRELEIDHKGFLGFGPKDPLDRDGSDLVQN